MTTINKRLKALLLLAIVCAANITFAQNCAAPPEAPVPTQEQKQKLDEAYTKYVQNNNNADNIIWYGRRLAYVGLYSQAIDIFEEGIEKFPKDARFYRHRGHRYITLRCFDKAIADFEKAAKLVRGKTDEIEPDGIPNARNTPLSTLHTNIYYHLGLAYFYKKNYAKAENAWKTCFDLSKNDDMKVATANWLNLVLQIQDKKAEAEKLWENLPKEPYLIENFDYWVILRLYFVEKPKTAEAIDEFVEAQFSGKRTGVSASTLLYGIAYYCQVNNISEKANELLERVKQTEQWGSFGFIGAERGF